MLILATSLHRALAALCVHTLMLSECEGDNVLAFPPAPLFALTGAGTRGDNVLTGTDVSGDDLCNARPRRCLLPHHDYLLPCTERLRR